MSSVNLGRGPTGLQSERVGEAILQVWRPGEPAKFYRVPGNNEGEFMAKLSIKHLQGRIIAVNEDRQYRGNIIQPLMLDRITEESLNKQGFRLVAFPTDPALSVVPAKRPVPDLESDESTKLMTIASDPLFYYNHLINTADEPVSQISVAQVREVFSFVGYEISDATMEKIRNKKVPFQSDSSYDRRNPEHASFMMAIAEMPANNKPTLVRNASIISLFDECNSAKPVTTTNQQTVKPSQKPALR